MGLRVHCDGCECQGTTETLTLVGVLQPVHYCPDCLGVWTGYEAAEAAKHAEIVTAFEAWRADALTALRATLKAVPDA